MNRAATHYELLYVSSDATFEQIRSAYLRLMKRHHPDVAGEQAETADFLPLINQAYELLGDPIKRRAYDAELARQAEAARPVGATHHPAAVTPVRPKPVASSAQPWWALWAALAIALCTAAVMLVPSHPGAAERDDSPALGIGWFQPEAMASQSTGAARFPARDDISREARRGAAAAALEAIRQSKQCFDGARDRKSVDAAQLCIVFDQAFLYTHKESGDGLPPYFNALVVGFRHSAALEVAPDAPFLNRLSRATFAALMADYRPFLATPPVERSAGRGGGGGRSAKNDTSAAVQTKRDLPRNGTGADR